MFIYVWFLYVNSIQLVQGPPVQFAPFFLLAAHIKLDVINVFFMCTGAQFYGRGVVQVLTQVVSHFSHCSITAGIIIRIKKKKSYE